LNATESAILWKKWKNEGFGMCRKESAGSWGRGLFSKLQMQAMMMQGRSFGKGRYHGNSAKPLPKPHVRWLLEASESQLDWFDQVRSAVSAFLS
jgi:hypothetical protein